MKNLKTFEQFLNESNQIQALSNDFGGYDNSKFLRISWHLGIDELEYLLKVTSSDLKFTKAHNKGILGAFNRKDSQFLKSRIEFLNQIIASKKSDPSYIPDAYKNK